MNRIPAETPAWREKYDAATRFRHVGRMRVHKWAGTWYLVGEKVRPDLFTKRSAS